MLLALPKNPQIYQTLFLMLLLNLGILFFGLYFDYTKLCIVFASCIGFDMLFHYLRERKWIFPYSGVNVGFGISFFLRTDILILYVLAAFLGIISKYIFRIEGRHFLNPSNFGVFLVISIFPLITWTNPLQWGKIYGGTIYYYGLIALVLLFGSMVVWRVIVGKGLNLLWLIVPFIVTHLLMYTFFTNEGFGYAFTKWYTIAFLIFTFHMITDPQTILENITSRILFGSSIAVLVYLLQYYINENYAHLASLFLLTLVIPLVRHFDSLRFQIGQYITYGNLIMGAIWGVIFIAFLGSAGYYGLPDLVFDNRCRSLFCT